MLSFLILLVTYCPFPSLPLPPASYKNVSLAGPQGCGLGGHKQNFYLNKGNGILHQLFPCPVQVSINKELNDENHKRKVG